MELEPITRQEKIIAGQDLTPITRMEKFLKQYGGGGGGGGSTDAVLYTAQTLTDAQKKQARENIDAASDFVVNAIVTGETSASLDKTFEQIQAAVNGGKRAIAKIPGVFYLPLYYIDQKKIIFGSVTSFTSSSIDIFRLTVDNQNICKFSVDFAAQLNPNGTMPPIYMESNPIDDMEIATKKYVDDKECILKSTTPGSTKKFKITVDDSGAISATEVTE